MKTIEFLRKAVLSMIVVWACSSASAVVRYHRTYVVHHPRTTVVVNKNVVKRHHGPRTTVVVRTHKRVMHRR
jgi:hypothetical protein